MYDFKKMTLYITLEKDLDDFLREATDHKKVRRSQLQSCSCMECKGTDEHNMRIQYCECESSEQCELRFRIKTCQLNGDIEVSRSHQEFCMEKVGGILGNLGRPKEMRG